MNKKATFADSFWGSDFQSTVGYDAIKKQVKDGKQSCFAFEQFLRLRAKAEEEYSKNLQKAFKCSGDSQESGTLRVAWEMLKDQSERISQIHLEASIHLLDAAARLNEFTKRQKAERNPRENAVNQTAKEKVNLYRKTLESKKTYEIKSSEAEQAEIVYQKAKPNENSYPTKEWDKIILKQSKSLQEVQKAESIYTDYITNLEQSRLQWERNMTQYCVLCESLEEARIKMMQNEMWICCNLISSNCVEEDQCCEFVRNSLEKVSVESDIQSFINRAKTGSEKPAPLKFEKYQTAVQMPSVADSGTHLDGGNRLIPQGGRTVLPDHRLQLPASTPQNSGTLYVANRNYNHR